MKIFILSALMIFMSAHCIGKQPVQYELSGSWGLKSTNGESIYAGMKGLATIFTMGIVNFRSENIRESGPFLVSWKCVPRRRMGFGLSAGMLNVDYDAVTGLLWTEEIRHNVKYSAYTIAPELDFRYVQSDKLTIYSALSIGYSIIAHKGTPDSREISEKRSSSDLHISLAGIRVGGNVGGFAELGLGYKGLIHFGISCRIR